MHSEACRKRIEGLLKGDSVGAARLAAADERITLALADAVERHTTKDPGVRGILKRASVVRHPQSEPQKKIGHGAGPDTTLHSLAWRIISIRRATQHQHRHRLEQRRDRMRAGPAQDVTRTSSEDHIGGDVAIRRDGADENSGGAQQGQTAEGGSQRKREPREARDEQSSAAEKACSEKDLREDDSPRTRRCCHHARGIGWVPGENNEDRACREQRTELGVDFVGRSTRHDAL